MRSGLRLRRKPTPAEAPQSQLEHQRQTIWNKLPLATQVIFAAMSSNPVSCDRFFIEHFLLKTAGRVSTPMLIEAQLLRCESADEYRTRWQAEMAEMVRKAKMKRPRKRSHLEECLIREDTQLKTTANAQFFSFTPEMHEWMKKNSISFKPDWREVLR